MNRRRRPPGRSRDAAALAALARLRDSLRGAGNPDRAGRFSCDGCVGWCCREGWNSMRATPLEAEAVADLLASRGPGALAAAERRVRDAVERWRLDDERDPPRTYTCPFLTAGNRCGVHEAKPLGCVTFTPVRDGGCDQDGDLLSESLDGLPESVAGPGRDLPFPVAMLAALERRRAPPPPR